MTTRRYAEGTTVPTEASQAEIVRLLKRYGATEHATGETPSRAWVAFKMGGRTVRVTIPLPDPAEDRFKVTPSTGRARTPASRAEAYAQAARQAWRALKLLLNAQLEAIAAEIVDFDTAFQPWLLLPDGTTVGEHVKPGVEEAYRTGKTPPLLPGAPAGEGRFRLLGSGQ